MRAWIRPTEAEALRLIAAIDAELGPTEVIRERDGSRVSRSRKTWAVPVPLRDGTFAVPYKPRLDPITSRTRRIGGSDVTIPREADCATIADGDRPAGARGAAR